MPYECKLSLYYFKTSWIKTKVKQNSEAAKLQVLFQKQA